MSHQSNTIVVVVVVDVCFHVRMIANEFLSEFAAKIERKGTPVREGKEEIGTRNKLLFWLQHPCLLIQSNFVITNKNINLVVLCHFIDTISRL